jgi:hypothetical protein
VRRGSNKARLQDPQCCCAHGALCAQQQRAQHALAPRCAQQHTPRGMLRGRARRARHGVHRKTFGGQIVPGMLLGLYGAVLASCRQSALTLSVLAGISALSFGRHHGKMPTPPRLGRASKYRPLLFALVLAVATLGAILATTVLGQSLSSTDLCASKQATAENRAPAGVTISQAGSPRGPSHSNTHTHMREKLVFIGTCSVTHTRVCVCRGGTLIPKSDAK